AARVQPEAGVVAAAGSTVGDVHEAAMDRDAGRRRPTGSLDVGELEPAGRLGPEDRDLLALWMRCEEIPTVSRRLQPAGRAEGCAGSSTPRIEWRARDRGQGAVGMPIEGRDRVPAGWV